MKLMSIGLSLLALGFFTACTSYTPLKKLKHLGFDRDNVKKGKYINKVSGKDCSYTVLGYNIGQMRIDEALANARAGIKGGVLSDLNVNKNNSASAADFRYITDLSMNYEFDNYVLFSQSCVKVAGRAYK